MSRSKYNKGTLKDVFLLYLHNMGGGSYISGPLYLPVYTYPEHWDRMVAKIIKLSYVKHFVITFISKAFNLFRIFSESKNNKVGIMNVYLTKLLSI